MNRLRIRLIFCLILISLTGFKSHSRVIVKKINQSCAAVFYNRGLYLELLRSKHRNDYREYLEDKKISGRSILKRRGFAFRGKVYRIAFSKIRCEKKKEVIHAVFPRDRITSKGWKHFIEYTGKTGETLWRIAEWFTGSGGNATRIQKFNRISPSKLHKGQSLIIPKEILLPCFKPSDPTGSLIFQSDSRGRYAGYRLLKGQTIYSDVVIRFTPRITAKEVLNAAKIILSRSGLKDFQNIPANALIKIPLDLLSPQFLPESDPRRKKYESTLRETQLYKITSHAKSLKNVLVILDSGHGGIDPGASGRKGEKEDEYAYDILCRIKRILDKTRATVYTTIKDYDTGYTPRKSHFLSSGNNREKILTHPAYLIRDTGLALNLRWMLANYILDKKRPGKTTVEHCVFTSFHADSLHPTAQGLMVYIPGADYYKGRCKKTSSVYRRYREARKERKVRLSRRQQLKSEAYSRSFAKKIIAIARRMSVPVHSNQPIREYIVRKRKVWVPAVLKYCKIPTKILIELANMKNEQDRKRLRSPAFRQKLAEIYVRALKEHFEGR